MPLGTETTTFTRDVFGRYICNTLQEALDTTTAGGQAFDIFVIGGGSHAHRRGARTARRRANVRVADHHSAERTGVALRRRNAHRLDTGRAGQFRRDNGTLRSQGELGLLWYSLTQFRDFELSLDWKITQIGDNSGIFIRFPDPNGDPFNAVREGYEVQIDDLGTRTAP